VLVTFIPRHRLPESPSHYYHGAVLYRI